MQEKWIHWAWEKKLIPLEEEGICLHNPGVANLYKPGPDFLHASFSFDGLRWFGHIEIHVYSSDWYKHGHHQDPQYENVILHVVAFDDKPVVVNGTPLKTIVVSPPLSNVLKPLVKSPLFALPCHSLVKPLPIRFSAAYLHRFWMKRMERKKSDHSWEMAATRYLFLDLPFENVTPLNKRQRDERVLFEALKEIKDSKAYQRFVSTDFFIRFKAFFSALNASKLTKFEQKNLILNGVIPFFYVPENSQELVQVAKTIAPEKNTIVSLFHSIGIPCLDGFESQAILEIYRHLCQHKQCYTCEIGIIALSNEKKPTKIDFFL